VTNVLAVDLGGTNFRMAVVDPAGTILAREVLPTKEAGSVASGLQRLIEALGAGDLDTLVFGAPGVVDYREGRVVFAPNLDREFLAELSVGELERATGTKVLLVNDADLAAVGEARIGAGKGAGTVLYLTCSTGVGAGLVTGGRLLRSRYSTKRERKE
jgi:glucokinase